MPLVTKRPPQKNRRAFMSALYHMPLGDILDLEFDNDNDLPVTGEPLDWCQSRKMPRLT